jgi:hypothetical protein
MDEGGFYFIVDRAKDLVIRGGYNVYPRERPPRTPLAGTPDGDTGGSVVD